MHKARRTAILLALPSIVLLVPPSSTSDVVVVGTDVWVHGATLPQVALVRWAVGRYERAGLSLPSLTIYFHERRSECHGKLGFYTRDLIDMCPGELLNLVTRDTMLHEMAHAWSFHSLSEDKQEAFMRLRGISTWNSTDQPWSYRGFERVAEIVSWAIGDGVLTPSIPDSDEASLVADYELLTGSLPPALELSVPDAVVLQYLAHPLLSGHGADDVLATTLQALASTESAGASASARR